MRLDSFDIQTIEDFISGDASSEVTSKIESLISSNPSFKSEIELERTIIESIKDSRKNELKTRLSGLKPYPDFSRIIQYTTVSVAAATVISTVIYYSFFKKENYTFNKIHNTHQYTSAYKEHNNHLSTATASLQTTTVEEYTLQENITYTDNTQIQNNNTFDNSHHTTQEELSSDELSIDNVNDTEPTFIPSPTSPHVQEIEEETVISYSNEKMPKKNFGSSKNITETISEPNISILVDYSNDKFAYIFDGESLTLIGDFDKDYPYTVYELNFKKKMFFIKYKEAYYELKQTASLRLFKEVTNKAIIQKLENLNN